MCYSRSELIEIVKVLKKYKHVNILTDDIYEHILYQDKGANDTRFVNILEIDNSLKDRTIVINGVSKAYAMTGQKELAAEKFKYCANQFGSFESIVEYTIWAIGVNDKNLSEQLLDRLDLIMRNWNRHNKELNAESLKRLQAAKKLKQ